jgi:hypothetical protein
VSTWLRLFLLPLGLSLAFNAIASLINVIDGRPFAQDTIGWWAVAFSMAAQMVLTPGAPRRRAA